MGFPSTDLLQVIYFLLPGFVAAWIFYGLTAHPRQSPFERVVEALIFTAFVQASVAGIQLLLVWIGAHWLLLGTWSETSTFVVGVLLALPIGLAAAALSNNSLPHNRLPDWITKRTSAPSEWYSGFSAHPRYVYLRFKDGRTLHGWPSEWPDSPEKGHFLMTQPAWVLGNNDRAALPLVEAILVPVELVELVEFELPTDQMTSEILDENASSAEKLIREQEEEDCLTTKVAEESGAPNSGETDGSKAPHHGPPSDSDDHCP